MPKPIFIVGSGRSGTSVLTWAIGQHSNIIVTPETNWLSVLACYMGTLYDIGMAAAPAGHLARWKVSQPAFSEEFGKAVNAIIANTFDAYLPDRRLAMDGAELANGMQWFRSIDDPKSRWVDGTPSNTPYAIILADMFPDAKFINLVRNPREVVRSWLGISWRAEAHTDPAAVVDHIYHSTRCGYLIHAALGDERAVRVLFADVVAQPEEEMCRILKFLGESYESSCVEPITAGKMNSSGAPSDETLEEFAAIDQLPQLLEMDEWLQYAQNSDWRIMEPEAARAELLQYSRYRLLHPEAPEVATEAPAQVDPPLPPEMPTPAPSVQNEFARFVSKLGGWRR